MIITKCIRTSRKNNIKSKPKIYKVSKEYNILADEKMEIKNLEQKIEKFILFVIK